MNDIQANLTQRDAAVLHHVLRYRMSAPAVLRRIFELTPDAETALTRRLIKNGFLAQQRLFANQKYYHLTTKAALHFGQDDKVGRPLSGQQAAVNSYGILAFCCLGPVQRERITRLEFMAQFPQFVLRGVPAAAYYWDIDVCGVRRLGFIRVDHGGAARRLAHKAVIDVQKRAVMPVFQDLLRQKDGGFVIAIVTTNFDKVAAIRRELQSSSSIATFRVEVAQGLDQLVTGRSVHAESLSKED